MPSASKQSGGKAKESMPRKGAKPANGKAKVAGKFAPKKKAPMKGSKY